MAPKKPASTVAAAAPATDAPAAAEPVVEAPAAEVPAANGDAATDAKPADAPKKRGRKPGSTNKKAEKPPAPIGERRSTRIAGKPTTPEAEKKPAPAKKGGRKRKASEVDEKDDGAKDAEGETVEEAPAAKKVCSKNYNFFKEYYMLIQILGQARI